jgi:photosystem II stability/assembly factor-like uncharacterized protein
VRPAGRPPAAATAARRAAASGRTASSTSVSSRPYVNAFDIDPADGSFLLTTNRGFYRVAEDGGKVEQIRGTVTGEPGSSPVGSFLELKVVGPGRYVGSGHPDDEGPLPQFLGFIRSDDAGRTWRVVSRLGDADLHQIRLVGPERELFAFDAVLGAILKSRDGGRTWSEHITPRELVLDFVVDPEDPRHLVASTERELYRSTDGGDTWRPDDTGTRTRLAWPAPDALMRADQDGTFMMSGDGGRTWERTGRIDGEPYKLHALDAEHAFIALSDGSIIETRDGGRTFADRFRP